MIRAAAKWAVCRQANKSDVTEVLAGHSALHRSIAAPVMSPIDNRAAAICGGTPSSAQQAKVETMTYPTVVCVYPIGFNHLSDVV